MGHSRNKPPQTRLIVQLRSNHLVHSGAVIRSVLMSLEQAHNFYQALQDDAVLHAQYLTHCSCQIPPLETLAERSDRHWDTTAVLRFAMAQGYHFTLADLHQIWFGSSDYRTEHMGQVGLKMRTIERLNRQLAHS